MAVKSQKIKVRAIKMKTNTFLLNKKFKNLRSNVKQCFLNENQGLGEIIHILQKTLFGGIYNTYIS